MSKDSGPWFVGPESLNVGYVDPPGYCLLDFGKAAKAHAAHDDADAAFHGTGVRMEHLGSPLHAGSHGGTRRSSRTAS